MAVASPDRYLADLNPAQREAVLATEGPVLVVAGAGSGKTRVLTYRIAHLVAAVGVKPQEILAITFTNKAAGEMRERLETVVGDIARTMWVMTFHSACGRILRREAPRLGYRSNFTIYDQADQVRLVKQCLEELDRDPKRFVPRGIHAQISNAKNQLVSAEEYKSRVASFYDQTVADTYELYQRRMHASNAVDFDDLLMLTVEVLQRFPEARTKWQKAFRYVLVDEYQDTNHAQYRLLQLLAEKHKNLFAVGDLVVDAARREPLRVTLQLLQALLHEPDLIGLVVDREVRAIAQPLRLAPQDAPAGGMESEDPEPLAASPEQALEPLPHLAGSLVREGDGEDLVRLRTDRVDQVRDAIREDAGLAGPGAGDDEQRPLGGEHGLPLSGIEVREVLLRRGDGHGSMLARPSRPGRAVAHLPVPA